MSFAERKDSGWQAIIAELYTLVGRRRCRVDATLPKDILSCEPDTVRYFTCYRVTRKKLFVFSVSATRAT